MSAQHTPGPWHVANSEQGNVTIFGELEHRQAGFKECCVCIITPIKGQTEIDDANARLIAAAPDLLESLDKVWPFLQEDDGHGANAPAYQDAINAVKAAIAKAKEDNQ